MTDDRANDQDGDRADFVLLPPGGPASYGRREPGESTYEAIRRHLPGLGTQGAGRLRLWFTDTFGPDLPPNPLADKVIGRLGYHHPTGWYGPVAISMEEEGGTSEAPPLPDAVRATIDELVAASGEHPWR